MKRTFFVLSLLAFLMTGITTVHAQATISQNGKPVMTAYRNNFAGSLDQGDVMMAQAHQKKLVNFMERDITYRESAAATPNSPKPTEAAVKDLARQKEILAEIKGLTLDNAAALSAAKTKLPLLEEFEVLLNKKPAATH
jgi:hypothetical protein